MNRANLMLEVLRDGQRHSRRDLFERCGFFLTNNAASELRAQGHDIEQTRERVNGDVVYFYRLRGSLSEGGVGDPAITGAAHGDPREDGTGDSDLSLPVRPSENEPSLSTGTDQSSIDLLEAGDDGKHDRTDGGRLVPAESEQDLLFPSTSHRRPDWS